MKIKLLLALLVLSTAFSAAQAQEGRLGASGPSPQATIIINEQFLNAFLKAMFDHLKEPSMPLTVGGAQSSANCASEIRLKREVNSVQTAVRFEKGRIVAPLAFAGAYNASLLGCVAFTGWADTEMTMEFSPERRAVLARFRLREIHLNNTPALVNDPLRELVQTAIDRRYNPMELLTLEQLSTRQEIKPAGGALRLEALSARPEITPNTLVLHIAYRFVRG